MSSPLCTQPSYTLTDSSGIHDELGTEMNRSCFRADRTSHSFSKIAYLCRPLWAVRGQQSLFFMKNLMSFIVLATILVFSSCSKETITLSETDNLQQVINQDTDFDGKEIFLDTETADEESMEKAGITVKLQATVTSESQVNGKYYVNFSVNHDCTKSVLLANQTLLFTNAQGQSVSLTFAVNSYTGSNGTLQVVFDLGSHNLSGLALKTAQDIVIEELTIN